MTPIWPNKVVLPVKSSSFSLLEGSELATAVRKGRGGGWRVGRGGGLISVLPSITEGVLTSTGGQRLAVL